MENTQFDFRSPIYADPSKILRLSLKNG